jgi:adenylate kinase
MARGQLVPDDVVVGIVADRIEQADAHRGFILDGFPRTVPQAEALDKMLARKGLRLDAVVEIKVDPDILVRRIEHRVEQSKLRGEPLRADDNPEVLKQRLQAYEAQTAPLVQYYRGQGALRTVDGMASISDVAVDIGRMVADAAFRPVPARKSSSGRKGTSAKAAPKKPAAKARKAAKPAKAAARRKPAKAATRKPAKARPKAGKAAWDRRLTK